jgi:hypothetical protein
MTARANHLSSPGPEPATDTGSNSGHPDKGKLPACAGQVAARSPRRFLVHLHRFATHAFAVSATSSEGERPDRPPGQLPLSILSKPRRLPPDRRGEGGPSAELVAGRGYQGRRSVLLARVSPASMPASDPLAQRPRSTTSKGWGSAGLPMSWTSQGQDARGCPARRRFAPRLPAVDLPGIAQCQPPGSPPLDIAPSFRQWRCRTRLEPASTQSSEASPTRQPSRSPSPARRTLARRSASHRLLPPVQVHTPRTTVLKAARTARTRL